jgi:outer membrane murein-binding lipoprotein Lpp
MIVSRRMGILLSSALIAASSVTVSPARADDAQTDQLQREINEMQQKLQALQDQMAETRKAAKAAQQSAQHAEQAIPPDLYDAAKAKNYTKAPPSIMPPGVKVTFGGFLELAGIWRERNEVADVGSPGFSSLPFSNSPLYHENEFRFSARQSRISIKATGDVTPTQHLQGYFEMDFLGAGVTANSRESNSYQPRIRQAFVSYDNDDWHFHLLGGQAWSLLTQNKTGIIPLTENLPLTIDAQYVVGFNWARQPEIRFVEDWNKTVWFGVSVESPQVNFASNSIGVVGGPSQGAVSGGLTGSTNVGSPLPPGITLNDLNACQASGLLDSATACSADEFPDIVEKVAWDPGWGHYEAYGLQRFFSDRVYTTAIEGSGSDKTTFGWGVGGSVLLPVVQKYVDFTGSVLGGQGIGRYGSSQLPDVTVGTNGSLTPLQSIQFMFGLVGHATPDLDIYGYYGQEQVNANFWSIGSTNGGYGNPLFADNGCLLENQGAGTAGYNDAITGTTCTANVHRTQEFTVGFWQNIYNGKVGRFVFGAQYEYIRLSAFNGLPGPVTATSTPNQGLSPNNNVVMVSLRFYPGYPSLP